MFEALARLSSIENGTGIVSAGGWPEWMCQTGFDERLGHVLPREGFEELVIFVDGARDHVEIEPLRRARLLNMKSDRLSGEA